MAQGTSDEILEGFLCPICKEDLKSASQLTSHFESEHKEDQAVLKSLKGIIEKAKKKILNFDEADVKESIDRPNTYTNFEDSYSFYEVQEVGVSRSVTDYYKRVRSAKLERYAAETNRLLIRLDKLVSNMPTDPTSRKQYEQDVVPWLDGSSVKLCPGCAKSFNLTRRKHHCRLCGSILCHDCCVFLDISIARRMVDPSLKTSEAQASHSEGDASGLRLCEHCFGLIEMRKQIQDSRNTKTVLVTAYEQMRSLMDQAKPSVAMYEKMCDSLFEGETTYGLSDVNALRGRIAKLAEGIDLLSRQMAGLPAAPASRQHTLQAHLRQAAVHYIKEELLSLRKLPTEEEMAQVMRARRERAERQIEAERRRARTEGAGEERDGASEALAAAPRDARPDDDPLLEQINIIRGYIKEARQEMRFEEVAILEANLKELKREYQLKNHEHR